MVESQVIVMGAGPAGLSAAYLLTKEDVRCVVLERDDIVGGISRTVEHNGYRFDIGGHRFFTKVSAVESLWREVLGDDLLTRKRLSRIYYNRKFFSYPLKPLNALAGLGLLETMRCVGSYAWSHVSPIRPEDNFEAWVSNRFGRRLFDIFFRSYTEKVWGMPCSEIQADWAAQRIKGLSLAAAIKDAVVGKRGTGGAVVKTLIDEFLYPRFGPGMMWERTQQLAEAGGAEVKLRSPIESIRWTEAGVESIASGGSQYKAPSYISSIAMDELVQALEPAPPDAVIDAAKRLRYRDFLTVALVLRRADMFPDNWIYVHDPKVRLGRIQNFGNWSPDMLATPDTTCLGLEYFCERDDELWAQDDAALAALGASEAARLGLIDKEDVIDSAVVRMPKAYPVYDAGYGEAVETIRRFVQSSLPNLQLVGRNGMHRYNNQDHSMLTAMLAVRNILGGKYDLWQVNVDDDYHETGASITEDEIREMELSQPLTPTRKS